MERADDLALLMTLEMGKPLAESKSEIVYAADFFRWHSGDALGRRPLQRSRTARAACSR